jgi:hypothetical protein
MQKRDCGHPNEKICLTPRFVSNSAAQAAAKFAKLPMNRHQSREGGGEDKGQTSIEQWLNSLAKGMGWGCHRPHHTNTNTAASSSAVSFGTWQNAH